MQKPISIIVILSLLFVWFMLDQTQAEEIIWKKDGAKIALIPAGSFEMGDHLDNMASSLPVHTVELDAFYMDVNEVTVGQFKQFVAASGYDYDFNEDWDGLGPVAEYSPTDEHPMVYVSWNDAVAYCDWVGKRLPTEAEWEYAARGGLIGKRYPWGNEITHNDANWGNTVSGKDKWDKCAPVGSFEANGYGLHDMVGNVWEWCEDWYDPAAKKERVLRGGSSASDSGLVLLSSFRQHYVPDYRRPSFRCVLTEGSGQ